MRLQKSIDSVSRRIIYGIINKYGEYKNWIESEREKAIYYTPISDGQPHGNAVGNPTESAAERLLRIEQSPKARIVQAVECAKDTFAINDIASESERKKLLKAVWLSCLNARQYNFEAFAGLIPCERRKFYEYKVEFLLAIKHNLGL